MRGILRYIFVLWRKDERNFSIVHTDLLMYIVIKFRMRYNIIKDLWLYEPRIISNYLINLEKNIILLSRGKLYD